MITDIFILTYTLYKSYYYFLILKIENIKCTQMDTRLLNLHNKIVLIAKDDNLYTTSCNENSLAFLDQNCRYFRSSNY